MAKTNVAPDVDIDEVTGAIPERPDANTQALQMVTEVLGRLVDKNEAGPIPQIPVARAILPTPWHPSGSKVRPELARTAYLNGHRLREIMMSDEEITLINGLRAGRYMNRKWTVVDTDGDGNAASIQIFLPNKTEAERLEQKSLARNFVEVLRMIHAEMATRPEARSA